MQVDVDALIRNLNAASDARYEEDVRREYKNITLIGLLVTLLGLLAMHLEPESWRYPLYCLAGLVGSTCFGVGFFYLKVLKPQK